MKKLTDPWVPVFPTAGSDPDIAPKVKKPARPERYVKQCLDTLKETYRLVNRRGELLAELIGRQETEVKQTNPSNRKSAKDSFTRLQVRLRETVDAANKRSVSIQKLYDTGKHGQIK